MTSGNIEHSILKEYRNFKKKKIRTYLRSGALLTLAVIPYFIYEDIYVNGLPAQTLIFRMIPIVISVVILAFVLTPLRHRLTVIVYLYYVGIAAYMVMMTGLVVIAADTPHYSLMILGMTTVIFCIYIISVSGMKPLVPLYFVPLAGLAVYLGVTGIVSTPKLAMLSNPTVTALICAFLSEVQERLRYSEFRAGRIIELQNTELREKGDIIREQNDLLNRDLDLARTIQTNIIPLAMPQLPGIRLSSVYAPMLRVGGDYYDFIVMRETNLLGIFISDVSGHGVSAALIAGMVKTLIITAGEQKRIPAELLGYINEKLIGQTSGNFVTAFYAVYDIEKKLIRYARGGHEFPFLIRDDAVEELKSEGKFLGLLENISFEEREVQLRAGDALLFYTDGLTEAADPNGAMFREKLISGLPASIWDDDRSKAAQIYDSLVAFRGDSSFDDDVCIIYMEVLPDGTIGGKRITAEAESISGNGEQ